jgi:hypothetical protein
MYLVKWETQEIIKVVIVVVLVKEHLFRVDNQLSDLIYIISKTNE